MGEASQDAMSLMTQTNNNDKTTTKTTHTTKQLKH
jgi:hypothetical protein